MTSEIKPIPDISPLLADAALRGTLVPFIGAGASRLAGCPSWIDFADKAIDFLVAERVMNPAQRSQIGHLPPRLKLSVAKLAAKEASVEIDFRKLLQRQDWRENPKGLQLYGYLALIARRFVTTNYDEWLDDILPVPKLESDLGKEQDFKTVTESRRCLYLPEHFTPAQFGSPDCVVHLHGSLIDTNSLVLSTSDYIRLYAADRHRRGGEGENNVLTFLDHLFSTMNVLFIGYGLEELEILEYIILKSKSSSMLPLEPRHFILQGFFSFEFEFYKSLKHYFRDECGIELIPFRKDERDWDQLISVVEAFTKSIRASKQPLLQDFIEMEGLVDG